MNSSSSEIIGQHKIGSFVFFQQWERVDVEAVRASVLRRHQPLQLRGAAAGHLQVEADLRSGHSGRTRRRDGASPVARIPGNREDGKHPRLSCRLQGLFSAVIRWPVSGMVHSTEIAFLLLTQKPWVQSLKSFIWNFFMSLGFVDGAALQLSGQRRENVNRSHLVLASCALPPLQQKNLHHTKRRRPYYFWHYSLWTHF